ncbi:hypothetical protein B0I32_10487 [Nonomuraea fuscirosea]|uniref:Uncharacterized protein n=1 Tax=Nonomuraea fuscirosea TaxID=1291556 RepID=A0A2T0N4N8_9ACTN|nr:hypothetical protein B0I32_10487 [Nonomuraea fuscirosea]
MARPKRLRHRVPVKLRHHWKLVALCGAFLAAYWGCSAATPSART